MVVDISSSKSSISHTSPYSPEGPEVQFQLTLLHFHQLSFSCPLSSLPASAQVSTLLLFFFCVCHGVVNVGIQTSSHGYQHSNAQINTRGTSPHWFSSSEQSFHWDPPCFSVCVTLLVICHLDKILSTAFIQMDSGRELLTVLCNEKLFVYKMLHLHSPTSPSFNSWARSLHHAFP